MLKTQFRSIIKIFALFFLFKNNNKIEFVFLYPDYKTPQKHVYISGFLSTDHVLNKMCNRITLKMEPLFF